MAARDVRRKQRKYDDKKTACLRKSERSQSSMGPAHEPTTVISWSSARRCSGLWSYARLSGFALSDSLSFRWF